MCGRFYVPEKDIDDFAGLVNKVEKELLKKAGEICPGDYAPVMTPVQKNAADSTNIESICEDHAIHAIKWGFPSHNNRPIINARSETVNERPLFKLPFATRRCLVPVRGFFEWKNAENSKKRIKHYISLSDSSLMYLAGLYWFFKDKEGISVPGFTIITTQANSELEGIHDRMPVIIDHSEKHDWLYLKENTQRLYELMKPLRAGRLNVKIMD